MIFRNILKAAGSSLALVSVLMLMGGSAASALSVPGNVSTETLTKLNLQRVQFAATGFPTYYEDNFTNPPQIGEGFTLEESLRDAGGGIIGSNHIECTVVGFTTTALQFACQATFTFTNGSTLNVVTTFTFDPSNLPARYDAYIIGGTGMYARAIGVIHVTDPGPGNPTGYMFDFYVL